MKILQSGSFINLENREKIEELIFTAKELAGAAIAAVRQARLRLLRTQK